MKILDFIVNQVLREPSIFLGLIVLLGMLFLKRSFKDILVSTLKTIVGVRVLQIGTGLLVSSSKPMMTMLVNRFGLQGRVSDVWQGVGEVQEIMVDTPLVGQIGLILLIAWILHLLFSRISKLKVVYLTGHTAYTDTAMVTFFAWALTGWTDWRAILFAAVLLAIYWWLWPALMKKPLEKLVGDDNITIGHNMAVFGWVAMQIAKLTGDTSKDTEDLKLPGWMDIFKDSVIAYSIVMAFLYTFIGVLAGPVVGAEQAGGSNYIMFSFMQGINIAVGVTILLLGVRMFLAELLPAFKGFAKVIVPGATPAVDNPVFWTYAPQATLLGLIFTVLGMVVGVIIQVLIGSTYVTVPGVIPIFFGGCTLGAFASKYGGVRGTIISTFLLGIVQVFGSVWLAQVVNMKIAGGAHIDYCTYWPALLSVLKAILGVFGISGYAG